MTVFHNVAAKGGFSKVGKYESTINRQSEVLI